MCAFRRGLHWWMDLLTNLHTRLENTNNYSSKVHKSSQHPAYVITNRYLATVSNSGDSSVSSAQVLSSQSPVLNSVIYSLKVIVTLRLSVYGQSVYLGVRLLETHDRFFIQLNPCGHSPYVISSLTRNGSVVYYFCWLSPVQPFFGYCLHQLNKLQTSK
jgi:hypothetical protein